jgi:hypothetical protein
MKTKKIIKALKKALSNDALYSADELIYMKRQLRDLEESSKIMKSLTSKGFGK